MWSIAGPRQPAPIVLRPLPPPRISQARPAGVHLHARHRPADVVAVRQNPGALGREAPGNARPPLHLLPGLRLLHDVQYHVHVVAVRPDPDTEVRARPRDPNRCTGDHSGSQAQGGGSP